MIDAMGSHGKVLVSVKWVTCPSKTFVGISTVFIPATRFKFYPKGEEIRWALEGKSTTPSVANSVGSIDKRIWAGV